MKRFSFPLQFLIDYRKRKEDRLKVELARVIAEEEREKKILEELKKTLALCQEELREKREKVEVALVLFYYSYLEKLMARIDEQKRKMEKLIQERKKLHRQLIRASQERKLVEKMKERRWAEFIYLQGKLEQQVMDESAIVRFHHRTKS